ncbi:MAG: hypothetical protein HC803_06915 [Saprospiraceae bacterium]|nr:hypothetical protein [Saprospiraceae bacterium]
MLNAINSSGLLYDKPDTKEVDSSESINETIWTSTNSYKRLLRYFLQSLRDYFARFKEQNISLEDFSTRLRNIQSIKRQNITNRFFLRNVNVQNLFSIKEIEITELPSEAKWIFLTGENGAGKTLILQSIAIGLYGKNEKYNFTTKKRNDS